jgi:hypothetical protein
MSGENAVKKKQPSAYQSCIQKLTLAKGGTTLKLEGVPPVAFRQDYACL